MVKRSDFEPNSRVEIVVSMFEGTDFTIIIAIDVQNNRDWGLKVLSEARVYAIMRYFHITY